MAGSAAKLWTAAAVGVLGVLLMAQDFGPVSPAFPAHTEYESEQLIAPKMHGLQLLIFVKILECPLIGDLILSLLKKQNKFHILRNLAANLDTLPTYRPLKLVSDQELQQTISLANRKPYSSILTDSIFRNEFLYGNTEDGESRHKDYQSNGGLLTVEVIHQAYAQGRKTPSQVMEEVLSNAEGLQHLNLFISLNESDVLAQAALSDVRWKEGRPLSVLDGVPIGVKDEFQVMGYPMSKGTKDLGPIATKDSPLIARLRELGAILVGKMNMHEIGVSPSGVNPNYGSAMNPFGESRDPGGSSSGSASAVASGLFPLAVGADGGGSLRIPASMTGTVGLSATFGRIPFHPGGAWSNLHPGFISSTVRDQMIAYAAVSGALPRQTYNPSGTLQLKTDSSSNSEVSASNPPIHFHGFDQQNDISDLTLGVYWDWFSDADPLVVSHCDALVKFMSHRFKVTIKNITIPHLTALSKGHLATIAAEFLSKEEKRYRNGKEYLPSTLVTLLFAKQLSAADFVYAQKVRTYFIDVFDEMFNEQGIDMIVTPTLGVLPPYLSEAVLNSKYGLSDLVTTKQVMKFIQPGNFLGIPAMSVPIAYTTDDNTQHEWEKLPIGIQLMAKPYDEAKLFRLGAWIEDRMFDRKFPPSANRARYSF